MEKDSREKYTGKKVITLALSDPRYPENMKVIADPPSCVYVMGSVDALSQKDAVVITGTGSPDSEEEALAALITTEFVKQGFAIVTGLIYPYDAVIQHCCHKAGGIVIAVLQESWNALLTINNRQLVSDILKNKGVLLSEHPVDHEQKIPEDFDPYRLMKGLGKGIIEIGLSRITRELITGSLDVEPGRYMASFRFTGKEYMDKRRGSKVVIRDNGFEVNADNLDYFIHLLKGMEKTG